jgi:hypothetical protein
MDGGRGIAPVVACPSPNDSAAGAGLADCIMPRYRMRAAERERGVRPAGLLRITRRLCKRQPARTGFHLPGGYQAIRLARGRGGALATEWAGALRGLELRAGTIAATGMRRAPSERFAMRWQQARRVTAAQCPATVWFVHDLSIRRRQPRREFRVSSFRAVSGYFPFWRPLCSPSGRHFRAWGHSARSSSLAHQR